MKEGVRFQIATFLILCVLVSVSSLLLYKGVNDAFYFDDYINLNALGGSGGVDDWESAREYIFGNVSGITGRPVSMATFLLDDNTWPSRAAPFKLTNIAIHSVVGMLIFWLSYLIAQLKSRQYASLIALFVAGVWLLNPLHISTVLYPVQRMAQLSTAFSVLAIIFYVKGRIKISQNELVVAGLLFFSVFLAFLMAVYSKENGALIPLLIGIVELWIVRYIGWPREWLFKSAWSLIVLGVFSLLGFIIYTVYSNGFFETYPGRDFSPYQRLITQPIVILFYLKEIFLPALYTSGFYYDDFSTVHSFISSYQAIFSSLGLVVLVWLSVKLFRCGYYSGLAACFFFSGHALESSVLNLELVFEHRNYLPSILLGFIWLDLFSLVRRYSKLGYLVIIIPSLTYPLFLYERASLWEDEVNFGKYLAETRPNSVRSHVELNNSLLQVGREEEAKDAIDKALELNPSNVYIAMHAVLVDCLLNEADDKNLAHLLSLARTEPFDGRNRLAFEKIYQYMNQKRCNFLTPSYFSELLSAFRDQKVNRGGLTGPSARLLSIYSDRFYINYPSYSPYDIVPLDRILESKNPEYLMTMAAQLANVAKYKEAMVLSERALSLVNDGEMGTSSRSRKGLEQNILHFQKTVKQDMGG